MQIKNLFRKIEEYYYVTVGTDGERINMPMYNTNFTIYKGVPNKIFFSVRNCDRKRVKLEDNQTLKLVIINQPLQIEMIKTLEVVDASIGKYQVTFTEDDMRELEPATYTGHVVIVDEDESTSTESITEVLFASENWNPLFSVDVKPNRMEIYKESVEIKDFNAEVYRDEHGIPMRKFVSSRIESNVSPFHTFQMVLKNFVGKVIIEGSTEMNPQSTDDDWFAIKEYEYTEPSDDESDDDVNVLLVNEECNCQWIRIKYIIRDDDYISEVVEAYYRN